MAGEGAGRGSLVAWTGQWQLGWRKGCTRKSAFNRRQNLQNTGLIGEWRKVEEEAAVRGDSWVTQAALGRETKSGRKQERVGWHLLSTTVYVPLDICDPTHVWEGGFALGKEDFAFICSHP